jgi:hypothetical protein
LEKTLKSGKSHGKKQRKEKSQLLKNEQAQGKVREWSRNWERVEKVKEK